MIGEACSTWDYVDASTGVGRAQLSRYQPASKQFSDSIYAAFFGSLWMEDTVHNPTIVGRYREIGDGGTNFQLYLGKDDSVRVAISSPKDSFLGEPFRFYIKRGYYRFSIKLEDLPPGVYRYSCTVGRAKASRKFVLMR